MRLRRTKAFSSIFFLVSTYSFSTYAADLFGNPTVIGTPGKFELQIGGGKSSDLAMDIKKSVTYIQFGTLASGTQSTPGASGTLKEDQILVGASYALNAQSQIFVNLGNGKDSGQKSNSRAIGIKIAPEVPPTEIKMGLVLRAQQVTVDIDGPFVYFPVLSDGTNQYFHNALSINGSEQLKYTRLDAFFGAGSSTGVFRPYGGLGLSRISGTDTLALNDNVSVTAFPIGGGAGTTSVQHVTINNNSDISASRYFSAIFGFSINPDSQLGMTTEFQIGVQKSIMLAGNIRF